MRLLFVVQRYGPEVAGGAETAAREVATRLAGRGHDVEVVTSCARSYMTWENEFAPGTTEIGGVRVTRLETRQPRDARRFDEVNGIVQELGNDAGDSLQRSWQWLQGPDLAGLEKTLRARAEDVDAAVFFTYLYATTNRGLPAVCDLVPTALVPCAHDEPPLRLRVNRRAFELADRHLFLTLEEAVLVAEELRVPRRSHTVGLGTDVGAEPPTDDEIVAFRDSHADGRAHLAYVGRIDPNKGADWLADVHRRWSSLGGGRDLPLVFVGDPVVPLPEHPSIRTTGWVSDRQRQAALAGSLALVHPSPYESFALTLIETWALDRPVLAHRRSPVLAGQVRRSGGGLLFDDLSSYDVAVDALRSSSGLAEELGRRGRDYVERCYRWDTVLDRWEEALAP